MTRIIAEACNNHMGDMRIAEAMIKAAADIGVDIIKFQSFRADKLRKDYPNYEEEYEYYKQHELSVEDHAFLISKCKEYGIGFLTTVFDLDTVDMLVDLGLKEVKIASPDANSWKLIDKCLASFDRVIISTGLHDIQELLYLMNYVRPEMDRVTLLHCVSGYPITKRIVGMSRMDFIADNGFNYGYSDHSIGTDAGKIAISKGASVLEKHFTLNPHLPGKDQFFAGTTEQFKELVECNKTVEAMSKYKNEVLESVRTKFIGRWGCNI